MEQLALHPEPELTALARAGGRRVPVAIGGSGKRKATAESGPRKRPSARLAELLRAQGLPEDFLDGCPLTASGKLQAVGNGVPRAMGLAVARAVKRATT